MRRAFSVTAAATLCLSALLMGCSPQTRALPSPPVVRVPPYLSSPQQKVDSVGSYDPDMPYVWQVDVRNKDLGALDLTDRAQDLLHSSFDSLTKWPALLPKSFDPGAILEKGKNPGLGTRLLHERGIDGRGVSIAIVDQTLMVDHAEYKDRLVMYDEVDAPERVQMHGPAVASMAVGKSVGTAPGASLYFVASFPKIVGEKGDLSSIDLGNWAKSVMRLVEVNKGLPADRKIRALSLSLTWSPEQAGYQEMVNAVEAAKDQEILVLGCTMAYDNFAYYGLGRGANADPDDLSSYGPMPYLADRFFDGEPVPGSDGGRETLLVPTDARTVAGYSGPEDYTFYGIGGYSWCPPYIAGLYALVCQVRPEATPEDFIKRIMETADSVNLSKDGKTLRFGKIVNPVRLVESYETK